MGCSCKHEEALAVVSWSGGFDSTLLLLKLLSQNRSVVAVTVEHEMTGEYKNGKERKAREHVLNWIASHIPQARLECIVQKVPSYTSNLYSSSNCCVDNASVSQKYKPNSWGSHPMQCVCQPVFWACNIIPLLPQRCELCFGYIESDHSLNYKTELIDSIVNLGKICCKTLDVTFPLMFYTKSEVLRELKKDFEGVMDLVYSCEQLGSNTATSNHCGLCHPCIELRDALVDLSLSPASSRSEKSYWETLLRSWFGITLNSQSIDTEGIYKCKTMEASVGEPDSTDLAAVSTCLFCGAEFLTKAAGRCLCDNCYNFLKEARRQSCVNDCLEEDDVDVSG